MSSISITHGFPRESDDLTKSYYAGCSVLTIHGMPNRSTAMRHMVLCRGVAMRQHRHDLAAKDLF